MDKNQKLNLSIQIEQARLLFKKLLSITTFFRKSKTKVYQIHDSIIISNETITQKKLDEKQNEIDEWQKRIKRARTFVKKYQTPIITTKQKDRKDG